MKNNNNNNNNLANNINNRSQFSPNPASTVSSDSANYSNNDHVAFDMPSNNFSNSNIDSSRINRLYDNSKAPPPNSRKYREYQAKRRKSMRTVALTSGNLVLDCKVPEKVLQNAIYKEGEEFTHLRYTAVTCNPDDFLKAKYTLRPSLYGRTTELFIVLTMYNENDELFNKTMSSVVKNITHLCKRNRSRTWGENGWQKVVVCIVADGRNKINERVLLMLGAMGVYQEGLAQNSVNGKPVTAHIYEYTSQVCVSNSLKIKGADNGYVPIQILFCLKEKNAKKINSHRWFFNSFGPILNPNVCVLIDVGTKPTSTSIYHLWKAFDRNPNLGGACGEIYAELGKGWHKIINPLVAVQNFEYKMSNILDKPLESVFGYISVLPGAFSAYRYAALQNSSPGVGPLASYFKGEELHGDNSNGGIFEANMYLAEDRILCFELVAKPKYKWTLKYVKSAKAETDVPDNVPELISQRRRWLNGSFFATFYATFHWYQIFRTSHSLFRKSILLFEFFYNFVNMCFSWFSLANFYLTFYFLSQSAISPPPGKKGALSIYGNGFFVGMRQLYIYSIIIIIILSLGNRPQGYKTLYTLVIILFSIIMILMLYLAGFTVYESFQGITVNNISDKIRHNTTFIEIVISLCSTYGLYLIASLLAFEPWHMITCFLQYLLLLPAFINILMVYAFCNTHDVSWGTKGDNSTGNDLGHVKTKTNAQGVEVANLEVPTEQVDINENYENLLKQLKNRPVEEKQHRDAKTKREDQNKQFRTNLVIAWISSNLLLVTLLTSSKFKEFSDKFRPDPTREFNPYLSFLFWVVAFISLVRFIGCVLYLSGRMVFG